MVDVPREVRERFHGTPEQDATSLVGPAPRFFESVLIEDHDPAWGERFEGASYALQERLGDRVVGVEHVGSTSVPGLAAKPIIDIDLRLEDVAVESDYVPALAELGYRLVLRQPWWWGHRMLVSRAEDVNLHVWPPDAPEPVRHRLFRDWLRTHDDDRDLYARSKRLLAEGTGSAPRGYTSAKDAVIDEIYERIFAAIDRGDLPYPPT